MIIFAKALGKNHQSLDFSKFYNETYHTVKRLAGHNMDLVQEIYIQLYLKVIPAYFGIIDNLTEIEAEKYVRRSIKNKIINHKKQLKNSVNYIESHCLESDCHIENIPAEGSDLPDLTDLERKMKNSSLSGEDAQVFYLMVLKGHSQNEASNITMYPTRKIRRLQKRLSSEN